MKSIKRKYSEDNFELKLYLDYILENRMGVGEDSIASLIFNNNKEQLSKFLYDYTFIYKNLKKLKTKDAELGILIGRFISIYEIVLDYTNLMVINKTKQKLLEM